ncbi:MAG TPA: hypothetical protein ENN69_07080 [Spirochaetia bacterium]|nr:hypothetical protein [Spirochaetia bacterium]
MTALKQEQRDTVKELKAEAKEQNNARMEEIKNLNKRITELETMLKAVEKDNASLSSELKELKTNHTILRKAISELTASVPAEEIGEGIGDTMFTYVLEDSKVPDAVIKGVGQFIDFRKYLKMAASQGAGNAVEKSREVLGKLD